MSVKGLIEIEIMEVVVFFFLSHLHLTNFWSATFLVFSLILSCLTSCGISLNLFLLLQLFQGFQGITGDRGADGPPGSPVCFCFGSVVLSSGRQKL